MVAEEYFKSGLRGDTRLSRLSKTHPIHWATMKLPEAECIELYEENERNKGHSEFNRHDPLFRNVLHVAASKEKPECVLWLLQHVKRIFDIKNARNLGGYTPLQELDFKLEALRTREAYFAGFPMNAILCLAALRDENETDSTDRERIRCGCTCGGCVKGFMSPRTQFALICKATEIYHMLNHSTSVDDDWRAENGDVLRYVNPDVQVSLALSQNLQHGFINIFFHIAEVLESQVIRIDQKERLGNEGQRPPRFRGLFSRLVQRKPRFRSFLRWRGTAMSGLGTVTIRKSSELSIRLYRSVGMIMSGNL
ncbi:hypothetical protein BKA65DRAFT_206454 [Rhexocercosporidium sp. MPI-PUGE-AT-0058]|nr:hypothetical protein BKA65DRAFT_206454 [Rhexocercosporidium sp. MPI-PUGE-AT-0058]